MNSSAIRENIDSAGTTLTNRMKVGGMAGMAGMEREEYRQFTLLKSVYTADTEGESKLATVSADL